MDTTGLCLITEDLDVNENIDQTKFKIKSIDRQRMVSPKTCCEVSCEVSSQTCIYNVKVDTSLTKIHQTDKLHLRSITVNTIRLETREGKPLTYALLDLVQRERAAAARFPEGVLNKIIREEDFFPSK